MPRVPKSATPTARGRQHTDKSLGAERAKVDDSIAHQRETTHRDSDRATGRSRRRTDEQTGAERARSDRELESVRAGKHASRANERADADQRLRIERARSDQVIAAERQRADQATDIERAETELAQREFFTKERGRTDRDLSREREYVDVDAKRAGLALARELAAHHLSRSELSTRDAFLALLSNDLRLPMHQIAVAAAHLRASAFLRYADPDDKTQVETISRNANEVLRLVGDLLERVELWQPSTTSKPRKKQEKKQVKTQVKKQVKKQVKRQATPALRAKKRAKPR